MYVQFGFVAILHRSLLIRNLLCSRLLAAIQVHYTLCIVSVWTVIITPTMEFSESDSDVASTMSYTVENANGIVEEISDQFKDILGTVKCKSVLNLRSDMFKKPNKDKCVDWLIEMCDTMRRTRMLLLGATQRIDELQRELIESQKFEIDAQKQLIECKENQIISMQQNVRSEIQNLQTEVKDTVQAEIKSYSEIVQKSASSSTANFAPENIEKMMKKVVEDDDRSKNLMVFGLEEGGDELLHDSVVNLLATLDEKPKLETVHRIGVSKPGYKRPVKIVLRSSEIVRQILLRSTRLKCNEKFSSVYLAPDRCLEERIKHRNLVLELREKRMGDNSKRFVIRNGHIIDVS